MTLFFGISTCIFLYGVLLPFYSTLYQQKLLENYANDSLIDFFIELEVCIRGEPSNKRKVSRINN